MEREEVVDHIEHALSLESVDGTDSTGYSPCGDQGGIVLTETDWVESARASVNDQSVKRIQRAGIRTRRRC